MKGYEKKSLEFINEFRQTQGYPPLVDLPPASPGETSDCVFARAFSDMGGTHVDGTGYVKIMGLDQYKGSYQIHNFRVPFAGRRLIRAFDNHRIKRLVTGRQINLKDYYKKPEPTVVHADKVMSRSERRMMKKLTAEAGRLIYEEEQEQRRRKARQEAALRLQTELLTEMWVGIGQDEEDEAEQDCFIGPVTQGVQRRRGDHQEQRPALLIK